MNHVNHVAYHPLSSLWNGAFEKPSTRHLTEAYRREARAWLPQAYVLGVLESLAYTVYHVVRLPFNLLYTPIALCKGSDNHLRDLAKNIAQIFTSAIGIVCPPLCYKLDECLESGNQYEWRTTPIFEFDFDEPAVNVSAVNVPAVDVPAVPNQINNFAQPNPQVENFLNLLAAVLSQEVSMAQEDLISYKPYFNKDTLSKLKGLLNEGSDKYNNALWVLDGGKGYMEVGLVLLLDAETDDHVKIFSNALISTIPDQDKEAVKAALRNAQTAYNSLKTQNPSLNVDTVLKDLFADDKDKVYPEFCEKMTRWSGSMTPYVGRLVESQPEDEG